MFLLTLILIINCFVVFLHLLKILARGKVYVISVEGNIGSGKSTLVQKLKLNNKFHVLQEPVDLWKSISDKNGNNILSEFYKDQKRYSYTFQNFAFITRIKQLQKMIEKVERKRNLFTNEYIIVERSIFSDKNVFAQKLHNDKLISDLEFELYNFWFDKLKSMAYVSAHIYLQVEPKISLQRVVKRSRNEEKNAIPIEYLNSLHYYHNKWLENTNKPILVINGNNDFENDRSIFNRISKTILHFVKKL